MGKKRSWHEINVEALNKLCEEEGYEIVWLNEYHARVLSGVCIVDIWPSRMKYHVLNIDGVEQSPRYEQMTEKFDKAEVNKLLTEGKL